MALHLIYGPPNSGRRGLILKRFVEALEHDPVLVVPTVDDVYSFEQELCEVGSMLGGEVVTLRGLFRAVLMASGSAPCQELTPAQRLRAISIAIAEKRDRLGPLRRSASRPGFAVAFDRLLDELQASGLEPEAVEASAGTLEGSAYLGDLATLFIAYRDLRDRIGRVDSHVLASKAIELLRDSGEPWRGRPVFLYGLDDLTGNQFELVQALAAVTEVTIALPFEEDSVALAARGALLEKLREVGVASEETTEPDPANTPEPLLFHLERGFGAVDPQRRHPSEGLVILHSAGERGEAEAIAGEVAALLASEVDPAKIAIALRDPGRRGPLLASVLNAYGIGTALEADLPTSTTSVGGTLIALLEAEFGAKKASDLLRFLRGQSGISPQSVDWFERQVRRHRIQSAEEALKLWEKTYESPPHDLLRVRQAARGSAVKLATEVGRLATTMASRPLRSGEDGSMPGTGDGRELRAAAAISGALADLSELEALAPSPLEVIATIENTRFRVWSGPVEGRVRIASPYLLRANRFDHVIVASLQDGEFPRHGGRDDPFLGDAQRASLGLHPRQDTEAEERYLFHSCLALPRERLFLSYRDSDENGAAEPPSPFLDDIRHLLEPSPQGEATHILEGSLTRGRPLAQVVPRVTEAPSENELARALAAHGPDADAAHLLGIAGAGGVTAQRIAKRLEEARTAVAATLAPGPLSNPATIDALSAVSASGGTTLERFDECSYRWFVDHELSPQSLDPESDSLVQGDLMHKALDRLYSERPGGDPLPRPGSLDTWIERGRQLLAEIAAERELGGHPAERAMIRRVDGLLGRFLAEEAARKAGGFEPWLLEAKFGDDDGNERPALEIGGWRLHGAIDRVDRDPDGRALVIDYKLSSKVAPRSKLEEEAKLQLQLYMVAVAEQWGAVPVGGLYHPLRGGAKRRPRGVVLDEAAEELAPYRLSKTDLVDQEGFEELLADARRRASEIVARMRRGDIRRDPGPRPGLSGHNVCPSFCDFAPICRRDRAPEVDDEEDEER
ncbi:MAG TPA: PD-(D/E)XK nuclease family protein [Solirubrobacterales bacterium]|jgi:ATP-dependent helicase/DNAse subunit B